MIGASPIATFGLHEMERRNLDSLKAEMERVVVKRDKLEIRIVSYDPGSDDPKERRAWHDLDHELDELCRWQGKLEKRIAEQEATVAALDAQWGAP